MIPLRTSLDYRNAIVYGLNQYSTKTLESFQLGITQGSQENILKCFEKFAYEIGNYEAKNHYKMYMSVEYCIVVVENWHIHGIIKKPFQKIEHTRELWQNITKQHAHVTFRTITKETRMDPLKINKMIDYFASQSSHHDLPVQFFKSNEWGLLSNEEINKQLKLNETKEDAFKKEIKKQEQTFKKLKRHFDPCVGFKTPTGIIFKLWSECTKEEKEQFGGKP